MIACARAQGERCRCPVRLTPQSTGCRSNYQPTLAGRLPKAIYWCGGLGPAHRRCLEAEGQRREEPSAAIWATTPTSPATSSPSPPVGYRMEKAERHGVGATRDSPSRCYFLS